MEPEALFTGLAVIVSAVATVVSIVAVVDARKSRSEASASAEAASKDAAKAADAVTATAAATERAAAALENSHLRDLRRDAQEIPWTAENVSSGRWRVTNRTGHTAEYVQFLVRPEIHFQTEDEKEFRDVGPGASSFVHFGGGLTDPPSADVVVTWRKPTGEAGEFTVTLG